MNIRRNSAVFIHIFGTFDQFFFNFDRKYVKTVNCSVINYISKERGGLQNCSIRVSIRGKNLC